MGFPIPWPGPAKLYGQRRAARMPAIMLFLLAMVGLPDGPFLAGFLNDRLSGIYGVEAIR